MISYAFAPEIVRVAVVLGVILSVLMYERTHLTTGGAIVPGYLAISMFTPLSVMMTLVGGILTYFVVTILIAKRFILYGRRKFEIEVLVGLAFGALFTTFASVFGDVDPWLATLGGIGFLLPGIVAHDIARQGVRKTLIAVTIVSVALALFLVAFNSVLSLSPGDDLSLVREIGSVTGFPRELLFGAVAVSVLIGMAVYGKLGVRSGGFITGAYVALISPRWADLAFTVAVALITWLIVTKVLMPRLLIFGRRKLASMLLVAALVGWTVEIFLIVLTNAEYIPWRGMTVATLMVPALVANDAERQGWRKTAVGTSITAASTVLVMAAVGAGLGYAGLM
ncbi:poly-gamma-glutamate biosynthesis protein PgsC [Hoyosella rhizosphaerae]|uniref:Poly-gamma-glutamate biosynthesis protein PgsC n=1 Tax=Hoyosella rhizosphaerae TaxID=1755582 RepID=A0A916U3T6_9ACTN|nr:poly-gamma-glutamate biosynthesis protein PgsC [Hoyosella rhizosphaerae]MBN4926814.1 poly-gamma-glutamate biosynthesis protein PgsC [Hoyosella rhizosphaerae]GGC56263.1 hypothetical protein GCM10011410_05900 [Hoyosella rhizosphaerae]